jgi:hypothetical protein
MKIMTERKLRALIYWIIFCLPCATVAQQHQTEKEHLLDGQFEVVTKTEDIPASVKQAFSKISCQSSFAMANPGQKFQATDVVLDRSLPFRRLVLAGVQKDRWFVHYERGGYAHSYYVVVFGVDSHGTAHFIWGCGCGVARTLDQLRKIVAECQSAGEESYW